MIEIEINREVVGNRDGAIGGFGGCCNPGLFRAHPSAPKFLRTVGSVMISMTFFSLVNTILVIR